MTFDARQRYEHTEERLKEIMDYILEKDDWITTYQIEKSPKRKTSLPESFSNKEVSNSYISLPVKNYASIP